MGVRNVLATAIAGLPVIQAAIPSISGFTLTWGDDFIGSANSLPSTSNWIIDTGTSYPGGPANWGTGEIQTYTSSTDNLKLNGNGALQITAIQSSSGAWTSARIETQLSSFVARAGGKMRIQASLNLPDVGSNGIGYWPAFWTLGSSYRGNYQNWPSVGEFDIMENVNAINRVWGVMHCGVNPGGPCRETDGLVGSRECPGSPCQGNFHTYTLEVDRSQELEAVRWFVDDILFWQVVETDLPADTWAQAVHNPHFVLLNLAIGGAFPNNNYGSATPLASTVSGGTLQAEYIAVYNN
ncbi:putative endo-beta-glucanase [Diaporthe ampelina]|uniref:Putative endo-beta-glucanase n=1 Tax=Diaporthe ampelina TaxID=1214573 RepID=A0A0G2FFC2_9PEZI|nr:putative endo-beta-glucanase [Diaporthe ampelina]